MQHHLTPIAVLVVLAGVTGCGSAQAPTAATASGTGATQTSGLGTRFAFTDASSGAQVGSITFTDVALAPAECVTDPIPGRVAVAVRAQIESIGTSRLATPDQWLLSTVDRAGITQRTEDAVLTNACLETFTYSASPKPGTTVAGWSVVQALPEMVALQFAPLVQDMSAPMDAIRFVTAAPSNVTIPLAVAPALATITPQPSAASAPATTAPEFVPESTTVPVTTTVSAPVKATPAVGVPCSLPDDGYATASDGSTLRCAKAGGPTAKWVQSVPLLGTRTPGASCEVGSGVATSPDGEEMFCLGQGPDTNVWTVLN